MGVLEKPINGFTEELFYAYSSRIKDTCTGTSQTHCHDGTVNQMGSSTGFILKNPVPSKTTPLYAAYSSRMHDTCTGLGSDQCHDGSDQSMGSLLGHMPTTQDITLQDIQSSALEEACPTCPPPTTTAATTQPPTTTTTTTQPPTTTTTTKPPILKTWSFYEAYNSRMKDTCSGTAGKECHDGTVQKQGRQIGFVLDKPIAGFTEELF